MHAFVSGDGGPLRYSFWREFEFTGKNVGPIDVALKAYVANDLLNPCRIFDFRLVLFIELKPVVRDDYPAVLRKMKQNGSEYLLVGQYTGVGATRQQFIDTFAASSKRVIFMDEVE